MTILHGMSSMTDRLIDAMTKTAARQYGRERVSELAHALQCAELAEGAGADEELILACLLHDVGRYAVAQEEISDTLEATSPRSGKALGHHEAGADLIARHVPERVVFLVRAHADAKRYLCATEPGYHDSLSDGSKHTLTLQGGVMTVEEVGRAATHRWWTDALRLRRWDDGAKAVGKKTRPLSAWKPLLRKYFDTSDVRR
jgi:predicted HD phosphohydrolase